MVVAPSSDHRGKGLAQQRCLHAGNRALAVGRRVDVVRADEKVGIAEAGGRAHAALPGQVARPLHDHRLARAVGIACRHQFAPALLHKLAAPLGIGPQLGNQPRVKVVEFDKFFDGRS